MVGEVSRAALGRQTNTCVQLPILAQVHLTVLCFPNVAVTGLYLPPNLQLRLTPLIIPLLPFPALCIRKWDLVPWGPLPDTVLYLFGNAMAKGTGEAQYCRDHFGPHLYCALYVFALSH